MKSDSWTSNSPNVSVNQTIKLARKKHYYYGWVCTNARSDKTVAHWKAWALLEYFQAIEQCTCEQALWLMTIENPNALNFAILLIPYISDWSNFMNSIFHKPEKILKL